MGLCSRSSAPLLFAALCACSPPPDSRADRAETATELRDAIEAPKNRAREAEARLREAAEKADAAVDRDGG